MFPIVVAGMLMTFAVQLWLCITKKTFSVKILPALVLLAGIIACSVLSVTTEKLSYAAAVYAIILFIALSFDALAWAIFGVVKLVDKHTK